MGEHHATRAQRVDMLGHIRQEGRDQGAPHRGRPRQDAKRHAPAVLLAGLSSSLKQSDPRRVAIVPLQRRALAVVSPSALSRC